MTQNMSWHFLKGVGAVFWGNIYPLTWYDLISVFFLRNTNSLFLFSCKFLLYSTACVRALNDRMYERRKAAALEIEKMVNCHHDKLCLTVGLGWGCDIIWISVVLVDKRFGWVWFYIISFGLMWSDFNNWF